MSIEQWWNNTDKENLNKEQCWKDNDGETGYGALVE